MYANSNQKAYLQQADICINVVLNLQIFILDLRSKSLLHAVYFFKCWYLFLVRYVYIWNILY